MTTPAEPGSSDPAAPPGPDEGHDPAPGWIARASRLVGRVRARALSLLDTVPGARTVVEELTRVEVVDRALAIGAQALLALLPLLVVVAAYTPDSFGNTVVEQVRGAMGLSRDLVGPVRDLVLTQSDVRSNTGLIGLLVALVSATSFSRALQRMYAKVFELTGAPRSGAIRSSVVWLFGWLAYLEVAASLVGWVRDRPHGALLGLAVTVVAQVAIWWWTARVMLLWRVGWSHLLPGAILTAAGMVLLFRGSELVMPRYARSSVEQFGSIGVVLAAASWLVAFGAVLLVATVLGRLFAAQPLWRGLVGRAGAEHSGSVRTQA